MKGLVIGDYLLPTEILEGFFHGDGIEAYIDSYEKLDFVVKTRADIRNVWRQLELNGPSGVPCPEAMPEMVEDVEVLVVHICPVSRETIQRAKKLKLIVSARGGLENIDMAEATKRGIPVIHTPHHNSNAVAEYTVGMMLAETRNIARSHLALREGKWQEFYPNSIFIPELTELKIGIVGFGQNGQLVCEKLKSFDTTILVSDPFVSDETVREAGFIPMGLDALLQEADIISLHVRLTKQTEKMIGEKEFSQMKKSAYLINTARSGLVDTQAMIEALKTKAIQGAAIDVFDQEPLPADSELTKLDNLTVTNHRAGDTRASYWNAPNLMRKQALQFFGGETPKFVANRGVLEK